MSNVFLHSPANIIQGLLVALGVAEEPPSTTWPAYVSQEPPTPDSVITVYGTSPREHGRSMIDGEIWRHQGYQIRLRAPSHEIGWPKMVAIRDALDDVLQRVVALESSRYLVHSVNRTTRIVEIGKEPISQRSIFTLNALSAIRVMS